MPRVISVFLPTLSTDRVRRKAGDTAPLLDAAHPGGPGWETKGRLGGGTQQRMPSGIPHRHARKQGSGAGAGSANPGRRPDCGCRSAERLAFWILQRFAPIVAADPPDEIVIDSTGADHLHGGEAATIAILVEKLAGVGLRARAAIADTWGAAHALARFDPRPGFVSEPGNAAHDIAPLSIAALRLAAAMVRDLHVLGFDSVGDVLAQPRAPLALRFGPELGRRLDQATGRLAEPIEPIRPEALMEVRPRLRRAHRGGTDRGAHYRRARHTALRRSGASRPGGTAARFDLPAC